MKARNLLTAGAAAGLVYTAVSLLAARSLIRPKRRFTYGVGPWLYGLPARDVFFPARGGETSISAWFIPNPGSRRAVVLVHGKDVSRGMELFGRFLELAGSLHRRGFSILMPDLRGHGLSGPGVFTFGLRERRDVLGALDWLQDQGFVPDSLGLLGVSLGSSACLGAAAGEGRLGAVVSDSGFAAIDPVIREHWRGESGLPDLFLPGVMAAARLLYGFDMACACPEEDARRIQSPLLVVHGEEDHLIPPVHARRLAAAAPRSELWLIPGAVHAGCYAADPEAYTARVAAFFEAHLPL